MDQVEDGNGIEYANTTYEPGHSPSCVINEPQYSLCELEVCKIEGSLLCGEIDNSWMKVFDCNSNHGPRCNY